MQVHETLTLEDCRLLIPEGYGPYIYAVYDIVRFSDPDIIPVDIYEDTVGKHIERGIGVISLLNWDLIEDDNLSAVLRDRALKQFSLHDFPEMFLDDVNALKVDMLNDRDIHEWLIMMQWSKSIYDVDLFRNFQNANKLLNQENPVVNIDFWIPGIVSNVIDIWDASMVFHRSLSKWVSGECFNPSLMPDDKTLVYAINKIKRYRKHLGMYNNQFIKHLCEFLDDTLLDIRKLWKNIHSVS